MFKKTVSVISSDPPCKDSNARFSMVFLTSLSDQVYIRFACYYLFKPFIFSCGLFAKVNSAYLAFKK